MKNMIKIPEEIWNNIDDGSLALNINYELIENDILILKDKILSLKNDFYSNDACFELTTKCNIISELAKCGYKKVCGFNDYLLSIFTYDSGEDN